VTTTAAADTTTPESDIDLFAPHVLVDPYPAYRVIRDLGPVVRLTAHPTYVIARYDDVRAALRDTEVFSSGQGVALTEMSNAAMAGNVIATDPPDHRTLRLILSEKLSLRPLRRLQADIEQRADALVAEVVRRETFDAVTDLAERFPVDVVADLIGLPAEGRETLLPGADAIFCSIGPMNDLLQERLPALMAVQEHLESVFDRERLTPGSWGASILDAVESGRIPHREGVMLLGAFLTAGMDTTVHAIGHYLRVLAERPDVWAALKADPTAVPAGFEEVLRLDAPAQGFFRITTADAVVDGLTVPAGSRVLLSYASAGRDERKYEYPDEFRLERAPREHLAFGFGVHACVGQTLARMEAKAVIESMLRRVEVLELAGDPERRLNSITRGLASLPLRVTRADAP
jgi:cytochrome P450